MDDYLTLCVGNSSKVCFSRKSQKRNEWVKIIIKLKQICVKLTLHPIKNSISWAIKNLIDRNQTETTFCDAKTIWGKWNDIPLVNAQLERAFFLHSPYGDYFECQFWKISNSNENGPVLDKPFQINHDFSNECKKISITIQKRSKYVVTTSQLQYILHQQPFQRFKYFDSQPHFSTFS